GMKVLVTGRVSVFPRDGAYQLYCDTMTPEGAGDLALAFEQLKEQLYKEGLFDEAHKKPLPRFPELIAIVTSSAGAAVHDMIRILRRRYPLAKVILLPVRVQGAEAPPEIAGAIRYADKWKIGDVIITGRGGGSMEDLWAFNEEIVARAIYASQVPVISAVGHEPDVTIADFVADLRAATPSNAAELAVPDQNDVAGRLNQLSARMEQAMSRRLGELSSKLERLSGSRALQNPMNYIEDRRVLLDYQRTRLAHGLSGTLNRERQHFARLAASLDAMSPLKVLARGYAIPRLEDGTVVRSKTDVVAGDSLRLRVADGEIPCIVKEYWLTDGREKADL
ncbi:MAG: exodeoxyribonuclease VII large subunit, partial [Pseudoflavonifractor capillosus]|uniref:exodeoxyribonuclease VII large subunit n=1 Tax=Pseudoflavonifractor capillosus TaxID=106588 RepID=UPI0023F6CA4C